MKHLVMLERKEVIKNQDNWSLSKGHGNMKETQLPNLEQFEQQQQQQCDPQYKINVHESTLT